MLHINLKLRVWAKLGLLLVNIILFKMMPITGTPWNPTNPSVLSCHVGMRHSR
jgi:hypothetical protein